MCRVQREQRRGTQHSLGGGGGTVLESFQEEVVHKPELEYNLELASKMRRTEGSRERKQPE